MRKFAIIAAFIAICIVIIGGALLMASSILKWVAVFAVFVLVYRKLVSQKLNFSFSRWLLPKINAMLHKDQKPQQ